MLVRLWRTHLGARPGLLVGLVALQLLGTLAALALPSLNGRIIDEGVAVGDTGFILRAGAVMLGVSLVQVVATIGVAWIASRCSSGLSAQVRSDVFAGVGRFSAQEVNRFGAATLISRSTNDVQQVQLVTNLGLSMMLSAPIMMVGGIIMALQEDVGLSWLVAVAVPVLGVGVGLLVSRMLPGFRTMQESVDSVNRILREQITGVRVVRAFVREQDERDRFAEANREYTASAVRVGNLFASVFPFAMLVLNLSTVVVVWFGAQRIDAGQMSVGSLTAFMTYLTQILMSVVMATMMTMMIPRAAVASGRIVEVLDTPSGVAPPAVPVAVPDGPLEVRLEGVTFTYPGADVPVLHDIDLVARPGTTTAVIGSTGAGKSTLVGLVPRLYDVTSGAVRLGGVDVRDAALEDVWARIGLVPQRAFLFAGTVGDNLRQGAPDASDEDLWVALEVARAADFVREQGGLDAPVGQGGGTLSGGQRQRLAMARAIVRRPDVYLFDDSFSALDVATDARVRAALRPWTREATVLVVAQRVASIMDADQIVVLEDGRVVGHGTHAELLRECPTYVEIVESQATEEVA
ncbi:ABC transporter ATP-binding protein [Janibacter cremeus]|uniref:ABC transporter ATP-binding protein n=1 Tax=Janibacter cremeus TaxID=1285192 RepID=UPI0023F8419D|nr:ABC transporter ATP-binding protein [Janibacter cremeus]WEV76783.1 ABC transporter ATP-binding protein [Janibacter cremeus]